MNRVHTALFLALLLVVAVPSAFAAEEGAERNSLDELFDNLTEDVVVTNGSPGAPAAPTRPVFLYFGTLETQGLLAAGWTDEARTMTATNLWYYLHLQGGIDVKPIPEARLIGTFSTFLPRDIDSAIVENLKKGSTQTNVPGVTAPSLNTSSALSLDELYLDYDVLHAATFRIGQFSLTWGQGRLFNPGNLVADTSGGVNLKGFLPLGYLNLTGVVVGNASYFAVKTKPRAEELGYAGSAEFSWGSLVLGASGYHQLVKGTTVGGSARTAIWGFDLYGEALANDRGGTWTPTLLGGIDREFDLGGKLRLASEYWYDGQRSGPDRRNVGVAGTWAPSALGMTLSAKWLHSITDGSGQLVAGIAAEPLPKLTVALGVPFTYGPATGTYVTGNSDPEKRLLAALLTVSVRLDFKKE